MFIRYFVEIPRPAAEVGDDLLRSPVRWASEAAERAESTGRRLLAEVGVASNGLRVRRQVEVVFGEPVRFPSRTVLPMTWRAAGLATLFPQLEADVEAAELGPDRTQLGISARYTPPLGGFGRALDRMLLHRVAESTVKDFLDRAARALSTPDPAGEAQAALMRRDPGMIAS